MLSLIVDNRYTITAVILFVLGFGNVIDWVRGRRENDIEGGWETMSAAKRREMLDAAMNEPEPAEEAKEDQSREQKDP